jgi:LysR family transcriptional regulator for metE and metH
MIEFRHFQTLIALAEAGNMARAAERIHLTQSALSHQIKGMEETYGTPLFVRKTNPLRWTPPGERLVALAYDVTRAIDDAERDIVRLLEGTSGELRIAVECHSCFDWLMPSMDRFRERWPEVEMDLVSGFHPDPVALLEENRAELVIVSHRQKRANVRFFPLFSYVQPALIARDHPLLKKKYLTATDFANETLITYPIPDERMDLMRQVLKPANIDPPRRTAMLTVAILQLVASKRGIATLPSWAIMPYLESGYIRAMPITKNGLRCNLYAAVRSSSEEVSYLKEFIHLMRDVSQKSLKDITLLDLD